MPSNLETVPGAEELNDAACLATNAPATESAELLETRPDATASIGQKQCILVTGHAGFIGFHVAKALLERGDQVVGIDSLNTLYDTRLKRERLTILNEVAAITGSSYKSIRADLTEGTTLTDCLENNRVQRVIHLAGQTDKFLSAASPILSVQNNVNVFVCMLEACRQFKIHHLTYASSHAVYGAGFEKPMSELDSANHPLRLDAATQRSCELMAHSYSHLFGIPTTALRFFSVYGPWGRPDSVQFAFARKILENKPIQIYNEGGNSRDYTYITDLVEAILRTNDNPAQPDVSWNRENPNQSTSDAPWQIVNIGASEPISIERLIGALESALGKKAIREYLTGPILEHSRSCADVTKLEKLTQFRPQMDFENGIFEFVSWFRGYYRI